MHRAVQVFFLGASLAITALPTHAGNGSNECQCSDLPSMIEELRFAIRMRDEHSEMAKSLKGDPREFNSENERYKKWAEVDLPKKLAEEAAAAAKESGKAPPKRRLRTYQFEPAGWNRMDFEGTVRKEDSADGRTSIDVFDAAKLASKVAEWRKKPGHSGHELCDHADADKLRKFASEGGVCKAIVESVVHHEDVHVEQCKAGGAENRYNKMFGKTKSRFVAPADLNVAFMQYQMRPAKDRALGETQAYSEQIEYLATAMRPLLKGKGVKIIKGNRGGSADELAQLEVECNGKLGLGVQGLKYACIGVNGTRKNMFVEAEGFTCGDEGREPHPRGYWQFRLLVTLTDQGTGSPLDMPALCLSPGERAPDPHDSIGLIAAA